MERRPLHLHLLLLFFLAWLMLLLLLQGVSSLQFRRDDFPDGFAFGAGTAAYQYEGAAAEDGRTPSIWDTYTHSGRHPEDGTGDVASDGYHKYKIQVVLYHSDLPQSLQDEYGGWINPKIVDDFTAYADVCFREFGDRVAHWTTVLEPNVMAQGCYDTGILPPNHCSYPFGSNCTGGNSTVEPYLFIHHNLLAHASAVRLYREKYQVAQKGIVGINMYSLWFYPLTDSAEDIGATERAKQFMYGWILHPLVFGDYPETIKKVVGSRLPFFSNYESELVTNAFDFVGLNHYSSVYTSNNNNVVKAPLQDLTADIATLFRATKNDTPTPEFLPGNTVDPQGLENALEYIRENYGNLTIYIQENGSGAPDGTLDDVERINYLQKYIAATLKAIRNGANVKGYSMWSFIDIYEIFGGYNSWHYGLVAVDFGSTERRRQPRRSASWYSDFLKNNARIRVEMAPLNGVNVDQYEMFGGYKAHFGLVAVDFGSKELRRQPSRSARWCSDFLKNNAIIKVEDGSVSMASHAQLWNAMETRRPLHLLLVFLSSPWLLLLLLLLVVQGTSSLQFTRDDFPHDFAFGAGTSAYQYEGGAAEDGRTPSIWDTYTHSGRHPEDETGDVASDGYHKYKEDVKLMSEIGLEAYRFTISWSRLIPSMATNIKFLFSVLDDVLSSSPRVLILSLDNPGGRGAVNLKALQFYNSMINELIHVVMYHMDLPQSLQDEYGGWISPKIVDDFTAYADVCFREFGDRVAHWTTVLEPNAMAQAGYDMGILPPNRCSYPFGSNCTAGNSSVEPYLFIHHSLLAHASAVRLYREKYKVAQKGIIGINIYSMWFYPFTDSAEDIGATERAKKILHPLVFGDYPDTMKKAAGSRLPIFSNHESEMVTNSFDFIGLNHYSSVYTSNNNNVVKAPLQDLTADVATLFRVYEVHSFCVCVYVFAVTKNDTPTPVAVKWFCLLLLKQFVPGTIVDPRGLEHALKYIREKYGNLPIYIQENGSGSSSETLDDVERINYLAKYIAATLKAIRSGANVKGYSMWSFVDLYELFGGYSTWHFGLVAVDFDSEKRRRQPRRSASWYSEFLKNNSVIRVEDGTE
uniref:Beta-glucosidase n=1 Tax=Oryza barthii TaxID=65489 RepID=A0A0D3G6Q4_9ORYZ